MTLQYLKNVGDEGAKRDSIYEYIKDVLPSGKIGEQSGAILNMYMRIDCEIQIPSSVIAFIYEKTLNLHVSYDYYCNVNTL